MLPFMETEICCLYYTGTPGLCRTQEAYNPKQKTDAPLLFELFFTRSRIQQHHKGITQ